MNAFAFVRTPWLRRGLCTWLAAVLLLPSLLGCAHQPARPATVELSGIVVDDARVARRNETGLVTIWRDGQRLEGVAGMPLRTGDRVDTGPSATAVIRYPSGSELLMRPGSSGRIGSLTEFVGSVFAKIRGAFQVETQFVRAAALGTQYLVTTGPNGQATVTVYDGRVQVDSLVGAWAPVIIAPGMAAHTLPRRLEQRPAVPDDVQRTRDWVERTEKMVAPRGGGAGQAIAIAAIFTAAAAVMIANSHDKPSQPDNPNPPPATQGRDPARNPPTQQQRPGPISGEQPTGSDRSPALRQCRAPLQVTWNAAANASDYVVSWQVRKDPSAPWSGSYTQGSAGTSAGIAPNTDGLVRWQVQARNGAGTGPASAWQYVACQTSTIVR